MLRQRRKAAQRYNKKSDRARNPPFFLPPSPQKRFFSCISAPQCPLPPTTPPSFAPYKALRWHKTFMGVNSSRDEHSLHHFDKNLSYLR